MEASFLIPTEEDPRAYDVALRIEKGETQKALAEEYGVSLMTIWRWRNKAVRRVMPDINQREEWRQELAATLADRIQNARDIGDDKALAMLADRFAKLLGLDHSDRINEALVRIEAAKLDMLASALAKALNDAGIEAETKVQIAEALDARLAELETT